MRSRALAVLPLLLLLAAPAGAAGADKISAQRRTELTNLLLQDCGSCHGMTLKGGLGRPLLPGDLAGKSVEALTGVVLDGIPGTPMPPWRGLLTEDEARWIVTRLKDGLAQGQKEGPKEGPQP